MDASPTFIFAWFFPILWNVIAMEAAACYVGECRGGARDAKIALTAEGVCTACSSTSRRRCMFVAVLGVALTTADPLTLYLKYTNHIFGAGSWEKWFVGAAADRGAGPVGAERDHGRAAGRCTRRPRTGSCRAGSRRRTGTACPDNAMVFNVVCSAILVLLGSPLRIYIISNGGYLLSCSLALAGLLRLPAPAAGRAAAVPAADLRQVDRAGWSSSAWMAIYFFGGWNSPKIVLAEPHQGPGLYLLGLLIVALYAPLYWWRAAQDRRLAAKGQPSRSAPAVAVTGDGGSSVLPGTR